MSEAPTYDLPPHERDVPYTAYLVQNKLSHRRLLPKESTHTFVYSTPYLCASLTALESHALDKGNGWLFGYGGISFRVTGLRESGYLQPAAFKGQTIKQKVEILLKRRGYDVDELLDVWILTMPTYLGYEGMNPLTVFFAYKKDGSPWLVLLEIHNTFYERHVHILEVNESSAIDKKSSKGYDYHWLFPREFHVSPFNDRSGFYGISVVLPFATAPSRFSGVPPPPPRARVRVDLFTESASDSSIPGPLKLIATIDPQTSVPFTAGNLRASLARQPVVLLRAWSRILYNAWILHYVKNLDVFLRPDPRPAIPAWSPSEALASAQSAEDSNGDTDSVTHPQVRVLEKDNGAYTLSLDLSNSGKQHVAGGVGWQPESSAEAFARARVADFLVRRVQELGVEVVFVPANPAIPRRHFKPTRFIQDEKLDSADKKGRGKLVVSHMSATVWTSLWASPSAEHALKVGEKEGQFVVNDRELFLQVFSAPSGTSSTSSKEFTYAQRLRASQIPPTSPLTALPVPPSHPIDASVSTWTYILTLYTLWTTFFFDYLTELAYGVFGARFVKGQEPWGWRVWERVGEKGSRMGEYLEGNVHEEGYIVGSVLKR